jgi:Holliday junction DNA helicase RuvB
VNACKIKQVPLPHILIFGPAGTGKTTLANICANEIGNVSFIDTIGSEFRNQKDIIKYLIKVASEQDHDKRVIFFIDEVHDLGKGNIQETLWYPVLEDFKFHHNLKGELIDDWLIQSNILKLEPFTIIGATTDPALLKPSMRDRFLVQCTLRAYSTDDLFKVIRFTVSQRGFNITDKAAITIAQCCRGNPRIGVNLVLACDNKRVVQSGKIITKEIVECVLHDLKIDKNGLNQNDLVILRTLKNSPKGVGISTLAGIVNLDRITLSDMHLDYLGRMGLLITTHRRFITDKGIKYLRSKR